ncbi:hypothetical protein [Luteimonas huabeiensis]|uniref:hypothetical protein n=1 Tax=Luteimonas huabeiensis TaxID=1244513 RepID=UPI000465EB8B|nr:hypothetical protein [Luteimonas huabeiensis]
MRLIAALLCLLSPAATLAQTPPVPPADGGCIEVVVDGQRVRDYACLGRLMAPATAAAGGPTAPTAAEAMARRAPTTLGLAHSEATRQRLGNAFGHGVRPQRPPPPAPALPPALRRNP